MDEFGAGMAQVLTLVNVLVALAGGALAGYFLVGQVAADPAWVSPDANARAVGLLTTSYSVAVGGLFYLGQVVAAVADGDTGWPRLATRFVLWLAFCFAMGVGTWLRLRVHEHVRHLEARARARDELS